jgi:hypothetical protein
MPERNGWSTEKYLFDYRGFDARGRNEGARIQRV